jgi:hypothetical protein
VIGAIPCAAAPPIALRRRPWAAADAAGALGIALVRAEALTNPR